MDDSVHLWCGVKKTTLHFAVDDHTGMIVGAWFDDEETLNGYYHIFHQILTRYGIPFKFFTDCRTIFTYTKNRLCQMTQAIQHKQLPVSRLEISKKAENLPADLIYG